MKIVYYVLSAFAALVVVVICPYTACVTINKKAVSNTPSKTEVVNLDKSYRVSKAKFKGHEYLLFESGEKGEKVMLSSLNTKLIARFAASNLIKRK